MFAGVLQTPWEHPVASCPSCLLTHSYINRTKRRLGAEIQAVPRRGNSWWAKRGLLGGHRGLLGGHTLMPFPSH